MFRKIKLYGHLAKITGFRYLKAKVSTTAEAVRFLIANFPALESHMSDKYYRVSLDKKHDLSYGELHNPVGNETICFIPIVGGASGNTAMMLLGVGLIALSFVSFGAGAFAGLGAIGSAGAAAGTGAASLAMFGIGASLVLGGVAQLLAPVPSTDMGVGSAKNPKQSPSYSFTGVQNNSRSGLPIPVVYGSCMVGSITISTGVDASTL